MVSILELVMAGDAAKMNCTRKTRRADIGIGKDFFLDSISCINKSIIIKAHNIFILEISNSIELHMYILHKL